MSLQTTVEDYTHPGGYTDSAHAQQRATEYCRTLEEGGILYFSSVPFALPEDDVAFLLGQKQSGLRVHKNISYRPRSDVLRGGAADDPAETQRLQQIMRDYSRQVTNVVDSFLLPYAPLRQLDFASYRSIEEKGRDLSFHKRNDLLHVDAFPTRPTNGGRILRVFTNINPSVSRVWEVGEPFEPLAQKRARDAGLDRFVKYSRSGARKMRRAIAPLLRPLGARTIDRSPFDHFMLHFHDWLKENQDFQQNSPKSRIEFPPMSTWLVYTDTVPHAVLSGQFALEQTFIIPVNAMVSPRHAPLRILETMSGTALAN